MRAVTLALVAAAALAATHASGAAGQRSTKASLRLVSLNPLVVRGTSFVARERVRVDLSGVAQERRRTAASRAGAFMVRFDGVAATRCDVIRVVAVGSGGSRAVLKYLPSPACLPA